LKIRQARKILKARKAGRLFASKSSRSKFAHKMSTVRKAIKRRADHIALTHATRYLSLRAFLNDYISPKPPVPTWMLDFHEAVLKASSKVLQLPRGRLGLREMMHMERTRFVDPEA